MMASSTPKSTTTLLFLGICILFLTSTQSTTYVPLFHAGSGMYTMEVEMGTPGQSLMLMLDGWSSDVWVPTIESLGPANRTHSMFNSHISNTYRDLNKQQILGYPHTGGNIVQVAVGTDVFSITKANNNNNNYYQKYDREESISTAPLPAALSSSSSHPDIHNLLVYLGVANKEDPWFLSVPWDGMVGLALDALAQMDTSAIVTRISTEANIPALFGLYYTTGYGYNGSELSIGGINNHYFFNPVNIPLYSSLLPSGTGGNSNSNPTDNPLYDLWRFRLPYITLLYSTKNTEDYTSATEAANMLSVGSWTMTNKNNKQQQQQQSSDALFVYDTTGTFTVHEERTITSLLQDTNNNNNNNNEGLNICANNIFCTGTIDITGGTLGFPIPQLISFIAAINATVNGQCIMDHAPYESTVPMMLKDPPYAVHNVPYQPKYVFCPNVTTYGKSMPVLTYTFSTSYGSDGTDTSNDLYDLPINPSTYCVSSWMDTFVNEEGTRIPYTHYAPHGMCRLLLSGVATSLAPDSYDFLLGSPFIQSYYTVLDANNYRVGLTGITNNGPFPSMYTQPNSGFWGSREMWAIVIAVIVCTIIGIGIYVVVRDRIREKHSQQVRDFFRGGQSSRSSSMFSINSTNNNNNNNEDDNYHQRILQDEIYSQEHDWNIQYNEDYIPNHYTATSIPTGNPTMMNSSFHHGGMNSHVITNTNISPSKPSILQSALYSLRGNGSPSTSFRGIRGSLNTSFYATTASNDYRDDSIEGTVIMNDALLPPSNYNNNSNNRQQYYRNTNNVSPTPPSSPYYSLRDGAVLRTSLGDLQGTGAHAFFDGQ